MSNPSARRLFESAERFLMNDELSGAITRGDYHGNLVLVGEPGTVYRATSERYADIFHDIIDHCGKHGYDDDERFHRVLKEMGVFDRRSYDRDCAIAISPEYELLGVGRYVEAVDTRNLKDSDAMRRARDIKQDHINGRHLAGLHFSSLDPDNSSIAMSESGRTIITFTGGNIDPSLSKSLRSYQAEPVPA
jgi:hypothetical protein